MSMNANDSLGSNNIVLFGNNDNARTVSSVELCELINRIRKEEGVSVELRHDHLLEKIREELGENVAPEFSGAVKYKDGLGFEKERPIYNLPKKEALQVIASESRRVRRRLIDEIERLTIENDKLKTQYSASYLNLTYEELIKQTLLITEERIKLLEDKIEQNKPLVTFANAVANSSNAISVGEFSKLLADENIKIGQNRLFEWFRANGYLMKNNEPYQKHIESEHFRVIEQSYKTPYGDKTGRKTLITGKGQICFAEKLRKEFERL